jgi:hypothetical protein
VPSFHARYLAGEYEPVWDDLLALGPRVREVPYYDDAVAVACETMRRVRRNCEVLIPRLEHLGWQFGYAWADVWGKGSFPREVQWEPPRLGQPAYASRLDAIEARNGLLPIALRAFYEIIGAINFVGTPFNRPNWPGVQDDIEGPIHAGGQFDPLYVAGIERAFGQDNIPRGPSPNEVFIQPDRLHKYYISGVGYDHIEIPSMNADGALIFEDAPQQTEGRNVTLVRCLRYALRGGGFLAFLPGWELEQMPAADLAYLTDGLEPI